MTELSSVQLSTICGGVNLGDALTQPPTTPWREQPIRAVPPAQWKQPEWYREQPIKASPSLVG